MDCKKDHALLHALDLIQPLNTLTMSAHPTNLAFFIIQQLKDTLGKTLLQLYIWYVEMMQDLPIWEI